MPAGVAKRSFIVGLAVVVAAGLLGASPATGQGKKRQVARKKPPFELGPQGGDQYNEISADRETGRIEIMRAYPNPGPFGCPDSHAGWANFKVRQRLKRRLRHVAVKYENYDGDGYTFLTVTVKRGKRSIGFRSLQGPAVAESGRLRAKLRKWPRKGKIRVLFGLQVSSSCPQGEAATVTMPQVNIRMGRARRR